MPNSQEIDIIFFDIWRTLAENILPSGGLAVYGTSEELLRELHVDLGFRIGIITTLFPGQTNAQAMQLLGDAGLAQYLDAGAFVSNNDAPAAPQLAIFLFAAQKTGVPIERCLYIGSRLVDIVGAQAAGMKTVWKHGGIVG